MDLYPEKGQLDLDQFDLVGLDVSGLPLDLLPSDFPVAVEIRDVAGRQVHRQDGIGFESVLNGAYLPYACSRTDCAAGRYKFRVIPSGDARPGLSYPVEVRGE